jgi:hypothetical protein
MIEWMLCRLPAVWQRSPVALAGINADFFKAEGSVINNMISGGYIIKGVSDAPYDQKGITYSQFAIDRKGKPHIGRYNFSGNIFSGKIVAELYGINSPYLENKNILYNCFTYPDEYSEKENLYRLTYLYNSNDTLYYLKGVFNKNSSLTIDRNDFVLYNGENIHLSDTVGILMKFSPELNDIFLLTGGWPAIIDSGCNIAIYSDSLERTFESFSKKRHPRTGIGFSKDSTTIYLFTVDGRQSLSKGMTLEEFADLMIAEGVHFGLNLDGGGSTTMVINGYVINNPSDFTGERKVGSAILVKKNNILQNLK